jgi:hypothetical protein
MLTIFWLGGLRDYFQDTGVHWRIILKREIGRLVVVMG